MIAYINKKASPKEGAESLVAIYVGVSKCMKPRFIRSLTFVPIPSVTANLLTEVCYDVLVEPDLQPHTGETLTSKTSNKTGGARVDIAAN